MLLQKRRRRLRIVLFVLLLFGSAALILQMHYLPLARRLITMQVDNETSNLINDAVDAQIAAEELRYDSLVLLEKDEAGNITALTMNMAEANRLRAGLLEEISRRIPDMTTQQLSVPLGNVVLPSLLSGRGGYLPVKIINLKSANAEFRSRFFEAGMNQTLHQVILDVSVRVMVLSPDGVLDLTVTTEVPVAQTVIVGVVPQTVISMTGDR